MKKLVAYKFSQEVLTAIESEAVRTGKTKTAVLEDAVLFQRQFGDEAEMALGSLAKEHAIPKRKVIEFSILKAAKIDRDYPFESPLAA